MRSTEWMIVGVCALFALGVRLVAVELFIARGTAFPDSQLYEAYAQSLARGTFAVGQDGARRAPGYPLFIAACWWAGRVDVDKDVPCSWAKRCVLYTQSLLSTVTCLMVFMTATRLQPTLLPAGTRWVAFTAVALNPYAVALSALELSESLFTTLMVLCAFWGTRLTVTDSSARDGLEALGVGAVAGAAVLVRPSGLLLALAGAVLWGAASGKNGWMRTAAALLGFVAVMSPWVMRNALRYGRFVPTTLNVGESLYDGLNPHATGASEMSFTASPDAKRLNEFERDRYWQHRAIQWAKTHPARVAGLAAIKLARFWSPWPNEPRFRTPTVVLATSLAAVPLWLAGLYGVWRLRSHAGVLLLTLLPAIYFCVLHMVFVSSVRYRVPATPLLTLACGAGAVWLGRRWFSPGKGVPERA